MFNNIFSSEVESKPEPLEVHTFRGDEARQIFALCDDLFIAKRDGECNIALFDLWTHIATLVPGVVTGKWSIDTTNSLSVKIIKSSE